MNNRFAAQSTFLCVAWMNTNDRMIRYVSIFSLLNRLVACRGTSFSPFSRSQCSYVCARLVPASGAIDGLCVAFRLRIFVRQTMTIKITATTRIRRGGRRLLLLSGSRAGVEAASGPPGFRLSIHRWIRRIVFAWSGSPSGGMTFRPSP